MQRNSEDRKLRNMCSKKSQKHFLKDPMKAHNSNFFEENFNPN